MSKQALIFTGGIVLVVIVSLSILLILNSPKKESAGQPVDQTVQQPRPEMDTVTLTKDGFIPKEIKIKRGVVVVWKNDTGSDGSVNSDDYPKDQLFPFLNLGRFGPGVSIQIQFNSAGTFTYHNEINPTQKGKVIVE